VIGISCLLDGNAPISTGFGIPSTKYPAVSFDTRGSCPEWLLYQRDIAPPNPRLCTPRGGGRSRCGRFARLRRLPAFRPTAASSKTQYGKIGRFCRENEASRALELVVILVPGRAFRGKSPGSGVGLAPWASRCLANSRLSRVPVPLGAVVIIPNAD
jgi:hypothetical protein